MPAFLLPFANVLQPLIDAFQQVILFFHDQGGMGWGLSIVVLTVAVRVVLLPLTIKQFKSMQSMQKIAPQLKELKAKYANDKQRQQQETIKLYQEHGVNPFASCLPLVLQLPVFLGLYYMLRNDLKASICPGIKAFAAAHHTTISNVACHQLPSSFVVKHGGVPGAEQFLFIPDLTDKASGAVMVALIVLYVGTQLSSTLLSPIADKNQRRIMLVLPIVFVAFIIRFPTGLIVYWITTNAWTAAQQIIIRRKIGGALPTPAPAGAAAAAPNGDGAGSIGGLLSSLGLGRSREEAKEPAAVGSGRAARKGGAAAEAAPQAAGRGGAKASSAGKGKPSSSSSDGGPRRSSAPPPPPPRKKKKRSGRRR